MTKPQGIITSLCICHSTDYFSAFQQIVLVSTSNMWLSRSGNVIFSIVSLHWARLQSSALQAWRLSSNQICHGDKKKRSVSHSFSDRTCRGQLVHHLKLRLNFLVAEVCVTVTANYTTWRHTMGPVKSMKTPPPLPRCTIAAQSLHISASFLHNAWFGVSCSIEEVSSADPSGSDIICFSLTICFVFLNSVKLFHCIKNKMTNHNKAIILTL